MNKSFTTYQLNGSSVNLDDEIPTTMHTWKHEIKHLTGNATHFVYVYSGRAVWNNPHTTYTFSLGAGMYCALPSNGTLWGDGEGVIITARGYKGMFTFGGPIEPYGRLRYIDGCSDSLLIPPIIEGDPCLNALYFPPHCEQTPHTHPSFRAGVVVSGWGECVTEEGCIALEPGLAFLIPKDEYHSFSTRDEELIVIAYHPDSDYGPTDENHPMLNRTMIDGVSASKIERVKTRA